MKTQSILVLAMVLFGTGYAMAGSWTTLDVPGGIDTSASGIDGDNIVGFYFEGSSRHGFLYDGTSWTTLDKPGATYTHAYDIDGDNIVGSYGDGSGDHGFVYVIPEPATLLLLGLGGLALLRKRRT